MKVENPIFDSHGGEVDCLHCPFCNRRGEMIKGMRKHCRDWSDRGEGACPTRRTYQAACELAEKETPS